MVYAARWIAHTAAAADTDTAEAAGGNELAMTDVDTSINGLKTEK